MKTLESTRGQCLVKINSRYSKHKKIAPGLEELMKISSAVRNELIDLVFSKYRFLTHSKEKGLHFRDDSFSMPQQRNKDKAYKISSGQFLQQYLQWHDINGDKVESTKSEDSMLNQVKEKHAKYLQKWMLNKVVADFWSEILGKVSIKPEPNKNGRYPKQVLIRPKPEGGTFKITLQYQEAGKWMAFAVFRKGEEVPDNYRKILDAQKYLGNLRFPAELKFNDGHVNVILTKNLIGEYKLISASLQEVEYEVGEKFKVGDKINNIWCLNPEYREVKKQIKSDGSKLYGFYNEFIREGEEAVMAVDPNVNNLSIAIVKEGKLIKTFLLDISSEARAYSAFKGRKGRKQRKLKKSNGVSTALSYRRIEDKQVSHRLNFQHQIVATLISISKKYGVKHILFGQGAGNHRGITGMPNMKNIGYNTIYNYLVDSCQEHGIWLAKVHEAYTSMASFLDGELPTKDNKINGAFHGVRGKYKKRHSFKTVSGFNVHADINAACNIAVKCGLLEGVLADRHLVCNPEKINLFNRVDILAEEA